ncbi:S26 family signal peptidase, partial [Parabacteroides sp. OttesenSCG-928-G21]|nr:S26 family signal peptidase [Parabacteroides sp. OttesenSCG-928-G21]
AGYFVNGELIPPSPYEFREYYFSATDHEVFSQVLTVLELNSREIEERGDSCMIQLTSFEEYQLREELPDNFILSEILDDVVEYTLIVPVANRSYPLDENSFVACREAIVREVGNSIEYRNDKLLTDGGETDFFIFRQNYYWLLSDNPHEAVDSRQLGFIPADHIVGNVWYRWYSPESERRFKSVY